jgi:hypothetical protein
MFLQLFRVPVQLFRVRWASLEIVAKHYTRTEGRHLQVKNHSGRRLEFFYKHGIYHDRMGWMLLMVSETEQNHSKMTTQPSPGILAIAQEIFGETYLLSQWLKVNSIVEPSLAVGSSTELWTSKAAEIEQAKSNIIGLANRLTKLVHGPHDFLHEFISPNWDLGALYTVLEFNILEQIPLDSQAHVSSLAAQIPENKLLRILRLVSCEDILEETSIGTFRHTSISEELVRDRQFRSFVAFQ